METDDEKVTLEDFTSSWRHLGFDDLMKMAWSLCRDCARLRRELDEANGVIR